MGLNDKTQTELERAIAADYLDITNEQHEILRRAAHRYAYLRKLALSSGMTQLPSFISAEDFEVYLDGMIGANYKIIPIHEREEQDAATAG